MGERLPNGAGAVPISDAAAETAADGTAFDAAEVLDLCERAQAVLGQDIDLIRSWDRGLVYEDEATVVRLDPGYVWGDVAERIADDEDRDVRGALVAAHDEQFRRDRSRWNWSSQAVTDALGAADAVFVAKPDPEDSFPRSDADGGRLLDVSQVVGPHGHAETTLSEAPNGRVDVDLSPWVDADGIGPSVGGHDVEKEFPGPVVVFEGFEWDADRETNVAETAHVGRIIHRPDAQRVRVDFEADERPAPSPGTYRVTFAPDPETNRNDDGTYTQTWVDADPGAVRDALDDASDPPDDGLDAEWAIAHGQDRRAPFNFVSEATMELRGSHGTVRVERTYRALPDHHSDESRDEVVVDSVTAHVETGEIVTETTDRFDVSDVVDATTDEFDADLRQWVRDHHLADPEVDYERVADAIPVCQQCGAYPDRDAGIYVEQRPTRQFGGDVGDVVCNHCYATFLADVTLLSDQEAEVYALRESGLSYGDIAAALDGVSRSQVGTVMGRVEEKIRAAREKREAADRTLELVDP